MKRLLLISIALLLTLSASAREIEPLLAPDGALFSIHTRLASDTPEVKTDAMQYLVLDSRRGGQMTSQIVPASLTRGAHSSAAMAYDPESKTLFLFWLHDTGTMSSELLFASLDESGTWSEATAFGARYNVRENLRIAVTRKVFDESQEKSAGGLSVHAVWWEFDSQHIGAGWSAQYAVLAIEKGRVEEVSFFDLGELTETPKAPKAVEGETESEVLRHPQLFASPTQDSVVVIYGDVATNRLRRARIFPVKGNGRLRVPVGRSEGGIGAPRLNVNSTSGVGSIYADADRIAFYTQESNEVRYVVLHNNQWTDVQSISLDSQITGAAAVDAIRRLIHD
jgi:hypothetical protein